MLRKENGWLIKVTLLVRSIAVWGLILISVVEQYRLLDLMLQIIRTADEHTGLPVCNDRTCPTMSAAG